MLLCKTQTFRQRSKPWVARDATKDTIESPFFKAGLYCIKFCQYLDGLRSRLKRASIFLKKS